MKKYREAPDALLFCSQGTKSQLDQMGGLEVKTWYLELRITGELDEKIKKLVKATGDDDEEIVIKAIKEYVEARVSD